MPSNAESRLSRRLPTFFAMYLEKHDVGLPSTLAVAVAAVSALPAATIGDDFTVCLLGIAACLWHKANS